MASLQDIQRRISSTKKTRRLRVPCKWFQRPS